MAVGPEALEPEHGMVRGGGPELRPRDVDVSRACRDLGRGAAGRGALILPGDSRMAAR